MLYISPVPHHLAAEIKLEIERNLPSRAAFSASGESRPEFYQSAQSFKHRPSFRLTLTSTILYAKSLNHSSHFSLSISINLGEYISGRTLVSFLLNHPSPKLSLNPMLLSRNFG
jgi:hypothetical protein